MIPNNRDDPTAWPPQNTQTATWVATHNFRFVRQPRQIGEKVWCEHCQKGSHSSAECWSTRAIP